MMTELERAQVELNRAALAWYQTRNDLDTDRALATAIKHFRRAAAQEVAQKLWSPTTTGLL